MDRKDDLFQCKLAEQACRYEEMVEAIGRIACISEVVLSIEEQLLLSTSYKRIVGKRCTWHVGMHGILQRVARQALPSHSTLPASPITRCTVADLFSVPMMARVVSRAAQRGLENSARARAI